MEIELLFKFKFRIPPNTRLYVQFGESSTFSRYYEYTIAGESVLVVDKAALENRTPIYFSIGQKYFDENNVILDAHRKGLCQLKSSSFRLDRHTTIAVESVVSSGRRLSKVLFYKNHNMSPLQVAKAASSSFVQIFSNAIDAYNLEQTEGAQNKGKYVIVSITQNKEVYTIFYRMIKE